MIPYCCPVFGMGGSMLDPIGGMRTLALRIHQETGCEIPADPFNEEQIADVLQALRLVDPRRPLFIVGDSCGANKAPWLAEALRPRFVTGIYCIQASVYCNAGCPDIPDNVGRALVIFSDWAHTNGLGCYIPKLAYDNRKTIYRQSFVPAAHPDDQDMLRVQNPIIADIKKALSK